MGYQWISAMCFMLSISFVCHYTDSMIAFSAFTWLTGQREGHPACNETECWCWLWWCDWSYSSFWVLTVPTAISIISCLAKSKIVSHSGAGLPRLLLNGGHQTSVVIVVVYKVFLQIIVISLFPFSVLTLLVGRQEGHLACKKFGVGLLLVMIWLELCTTFCSSCHCHFHHPLLQ